MATPKKLVLLLALLFANVVFISSELAASEERVKSSGVKEAMFRGGPGYPDYGRSTKVKFFDVRPGYPMRGCRLGCCEAYVSGPGCKRCCRHVLEVPNAEVKN